MCSSARKTGKTLNPEMENTSKISLYEQSREERIKENLQRMQSLGIFDLSLHLKSTSKKPTKRAAKAFDSPRLGCRKLAPPVTPSRPLRRSSRLQNVTPISYSEVVVAKKETALEEEGIKLEEGARPEIYTEKHEKLLGNTERSWTLFVDGYGKDGRRIYDPVRGKTCHQCRQKTLGYRTCCCQCKLVQGQFCGDCLYMRYGEHVLEALENQNWICPVCRGICNCSLCRTAKGWLPTGPIYRKITKLGYKSVAHYLIQTKRSETSSVKELDGTINQPSAKRSLSFLDRKALSEDPPKIFDDVEGMDKLRNGENGDDNGFQCEKKDKCEEVPFSHTDNKEASTVDLEVQDELKLSETHVEDEGEMKLAEEKEKELNLEDKENLEDKQENKLTDEEEDLNKKASTVHLEVRDECKLLEIHLEDKGESDLAGEKEKELNLAGKENQGNGISRKQKVSSEPNPDSIAGRLRQRHGTHNGFDIKKLAKDNVVSKEASTEHLEVQDELKLSETHPEDKGESELAGEKEKEENLEDQTDEKGKELNLAGKENQENDIGSESCQERNKRKRKVSIEPNLDSIVGRLRQRRKEITKESKGEPSDTIWR